MKMEKYLINEANLRIRLMNYRSTIKKFQEELFSVDDYQLSEQQIKINKELKELIDMVNDMLRY
jgi:cell fate (sporulation/competence/biofilm development) regulator YmcA (YheA/YmcA/DUF963 family)